jgi:two-component system sensor histidine kinase UhpB
MKEKIMQSNEDTKYFSEHFGSQSILDELPEAILIASLNYGKVLSNFLYTNKTATDLTGFSSEEFLSLNPLTVIFQKSENKAVEVLNELELNKSYLFETNLENKNKEHFLVEVYASISVVEGRSYIIFICRDAQLGSDYRTERKSLEKLRRLALRLQIIREEERKNIAREIHDELGQNLTFLKIQLSLLKKNTNYSEFQEKLNELITICDSTINSVQRITSQLRPDVLDELGLIPAIEWQLKKFKETTNIEYDFNVSCEEINLPSECETALFRIFQEALTNVARHSNANFVVAFKKLCKGNK